MAVDALRVPSRPADAAASSLMLILCPPVTHRELQIPLGLGSWVDRAWCSLEVRAAYPRARAPTAQHDDAYPLAELSFRPSSRAVDGDADANPA
jgi:hypothetical protein